MYYGYDWGWGWLLMALMMVLFWGGVVALVIWLFRSARPGTPPADSASETLRRRLAAGEITPDEYEKTRKLLQG